MDLIKIGKYIAGKRKNLGMTQKQLAEKIGMSDKSVSKWERGVCLPDVSVYSELCQALGITINELFACEDISQENIVRKSEENIIGIAADNKKKQNRLKLVIFILLTVLVVAALVTVKIWFLPPKPQNFIAPIERDSVEMKNAEMLSGNDGIFIYKYTASEEHTSLKIFMSEYQSGKLVSKQESDLSYESSSYPENGTIIIAPDFDNFTVKLIIVNGGAKLSTEMPILKGVFEREYYGRSASQISCKTPIRYDEEQGFLALIYDNDKMSVFNIQEFTEGKSELLAENDYVYYFSFMFCKK